MALGSRERANEDALKHVLKRRLPNLDHDDHRRYIEIECHKIVETLRAIRDEYRRHLEEGCKPIAEMYWVVFRFGIVQYAVRLLREIASEYVICTNVPFEEWELLYGACLLSPFRVDGNSRTPETPQTPSPESVKGVIRGLIGEGAFQRVLVGGPFGIEGQLLLTRRSPRFEFWGPGIDFFQIVKKRQALWEICNPWTSGLSQLFDSTQEELDFQWLSLADDAKRVESAFLKLTLLEKIAYHHLVDMRRGTATSRNLRERDWLALLDALDRRGIALEAELSKTPKRVLGALRRKGHQVTTWKECYRSERRVTMDNGKTYSLRREVTHAIHNAAKRAAYRLEKIWDLNR